MRQPPGAVQDRIRVLAAVECGLGIGVAAAEIFLRAGRVFGEMQQACRQRGVKHIHRGLAYLRPDPVALYHSNFIVIHGHSLSTGEGHGCRRVMRSTPGRR